MARQVEGQRWPAEPGQRAVPVAGAAAGGVQQDDSPGSAPPPPVDSNA
ncbi:hypothetical protein [Nonomuraea sp. NPDC005650]